MLNILLTIDFRLSRITKAFNICYNKLTSALNSNDLHPVCWQSLCYISYSQPQPLKKSMGYLIGAIVFGMLIWAGFDIAHTIRNRELNRSEINKKIQAEMVKETYCCQFFDSE
ncbi:hypothetical protein [Microcoleus asticus]|nr:hypothetical protein [Microcoleus asticus]